jgi:hypothetical protein
MRGTLQALTTGSLDETCWNETTLGILTFLRAGEILQPFFIYLYTYKNVKI